MAGKQEDADSLWKQTLHNSEVIIYRRLLQESHVRKEPQLVNKLIEYLKSNKSVSISTLGNAYSRLVSYYVSENNVTQAEKVLEEAIESGVQYEHLSKGSLYKLKAAVEGLGREFTHKIDTQ